MIWCNNRYCYANLMYGTDHNESTIIFWLWHHHIEKQVGIFNSIYHSWVSIHVYITSGGVYADSGAVSIFELMKPYMPESSWERLLVYTAFVITPGLLHKHAIVNDIVQLYQALWWDISCLYTRFVPLPMMWTHDSSHSRFLCVFHNDGLLSSFDFLARISS